MQDQQMKDKTALLTERIDGLRGLIFDEKKLLIELEKSRTTFIMSASMRETITNTISEVKKIITRLENELQKLIKENNSLLVQERTRKA